MLVKPCNIRLDNVMYCDLWFYLEDAADMVLITFYAICVLIILVTLAISLMKQKNELGKRCLTLLILVHILCLVMWLGPSVFAAFVLLIAAIGAIELARCSGANMLSTVLMTFSAAALFLLMKRFSLLLYVMLVPCLILLVLLFQPKFKPGHTQRQTWVLLLGLVTPCAAALSEVFDMGSGHVIAMILFVQFNDGIAYLAGKKFGRNKIGFVSVISPNKTLEGYLAGVCAILAAAVLLHTAIPVYPHQGMPARVMILVISVFIFANVGDLAFSSIKRRLGVKDFSSLLSGHGGVLDRFDSILCLAPAYLLLLKGGIL